MSSSPSSFISATVTNSTSRRISCVLLNAARLNYDSRISFDKLEAIPCDSGASSGSGSIGEEGKQREQEDNNNESKSVMTVQYYDKTDPKDVVERVNTATVVVNKEMPLTYEMITQFSSSVRLIVEAGTGYNNINLQACSERGIAVCNVPTYATEAMAHMVITYLMTFACSLPAQIHALAHNDRTYLQQCHLGTLPHFELTSKRLGLIGGLGTIGLRVAAMAQALGMEVVASSTSVPITGKPLETNNILVVSLEELFRTSDFVSIHCPLNETTQGLVDSNTLRWMKPSAYLINTARGPIVDADAVVVALNEKRLAGAALDVFGAGSAPPPALPDTSSLYQDTKNLLGTRLILTPHIGWQRIESRQRVVDTCAENIANYFNHDNHSSSSSSKSCNLIDTQTGRPVR